MFHLQQVCGIAPIPRKNNTTSVLQQQSKLASFQRGVTLLEMMIVLAIIAIVMTVVAPNVQSILIKNRIAGDLNELSAIIQYARNTAIDEQATTTICPSSDFSTCSNTWAQAKIVFIDANGNNQRDNEETLLVSTTKSAGVLNVSGPSSPIRFQDTGVTSTPASILFCHQSNAAKYARAITVSLQGRVKTSKDTNNDGVHEKNSGVNLVCG